MSEEIEGIRTLEEREMLNAMGAMKSILVNLGKKQKKRRGRRERKGG